MRVFLAGSTGVIGRRIAAAARGARSRGDCPLALAGRLRTSLAPRAPHPVVANALDASALASVVDAAAPDLVMHQLTDLAGGSSAANAELRRRGSRNLVDSARRAGVRRIVAQSIAWAYAPGVEPAREQTPLDRAAPEPQADDDNRSRGARGGGRGDCPSGSCCATASSTDQAPGMRRMV